MDAKKTTKMRVLFLESRCKHGMFFVPLGKDIVEAIDAVDANFIAATLCPVSAGGKSKKLALEQLRVLLCIDSPHLLRRLAANELKSRTMQMTEDGRLSEVTREGARRVLRDLPQVRGMAYLVGEEDGAGWK